MVYQASGFQWFSQKRPMTNVFDLWWAVEVAMFTLHFASRSGLTSIVMHFKMFRDIATWLNIKIKHLRFCKCPTTIPQNRLRVEPLISYITCTIYAFERGKHPHDCTKFFRSWTRGALLCKLVLAHLRNVAAFGSGGLELGDFGRARTRSPKRIRHVLNTYQ